MQGTIQHAPFVPMQSRPAQAVYISNAPQQPMQMMQPGQQLHWVEMHPMQPIAALHQPVRRTSQEAWAPTPTPATVQVLPPTSAKVMTVEEGRIQGSPPEKGPAAAQVRQAPRVTGVVRTTSGGPQLSPPRAVAKAAAAALTSAGGLSYCAPPSGSFSRVAVAAPVPMSALHSSTHVDGFAEDCHTCQDCQRQGCVQVRLTCGHTIRAFLQDPILSGRGDDHRTYQEQGTSPLPQRISRQASGPAQVPTLSPGLAGTGGMSSGATSLPSTTCHSKGPMSPPAGPLIPPSPQPTPASLYRKAPSSTPMQDGAAPQQMTSQSAAGSCKLGAALDKVSRRTSGPESTQPEVITDCRGDVLHKNCKVVLLQEGGSDKYQEIKVRGYVVGTFFDPEPSGPPLDTAAEIQVQISYVDSSEKNTLLMFPATSHGPRTFGDTEQPESSITKWKASFVKVGTKFS